MWRWFTSVLVMVRLVPFCCVMATGVAVALLGNQSFVANLSNFLGVLLVLFIPWSAISLAGYTPAQLMAGPAVPGARRSGRA